MQDGGHDAFQKPEHTKIKDGLSINSSFHGVSGGVEKSKCG